MKVNITEEVLKYWGVYRITNIITGDLYFGSTIESFKKRISKHMYSYWKWKLGDRSASPKLFEAMSEYGLDNFKIEIEKYFIRKKDSISNKRIATYVEERKIERYDSLYNICRKPTLSGCPNLGRKLSQEWKDNIGKKSKLYKHSDNLEIYNKKLQQNREGASKYRIWNGSKEFTGSFAECSTFCNHSGSVVNGWVTGEHKCISGWNIEQLKTQRKGIKLFIDNDIKEFISFGQCDRFLNMWRGFTSTQVVNRKDKILNYKYELN